MTEPSAPAGRAFRKRRRYFAILFVGFTAMLASLGGLATMLRTVPLGDSPAERLAIGTLFVFLLIVVGRYVSLLWFGFLQVVESLLAERDEDDSFTPPITVIVPAYNEEKVIAAAIQSLLALDYPAYEVLVVDDGSTDATYATARALEGRHGAAVVRVVSKQNAGKAAALNTGIALARHPFVLCMDGDSRLDPGTLRAAVRHFRDPRVGAVAGNVKVVNRRNLWTRLQALEYIEGLNMARRAQAFARVVNIIPGPVGLFRRSALQDAGGYATDTFAEDADLTIALLVDGWHVAFEDRAIAWTEAPEDLMTLLKQRYRWTRGILQALRKQASWLVLPRRGAGVWLSLLLMAFEALLWPAANVLANGAFAVIALQQGVPGAVLWWFVLLTLLDLSSALYTIAMEEEDLGLVPYAFIYRFYFIATIDIAKLFATIEELFRVPMTWGKLERAGRL